MCIRDREEEVDSFRRKEVNYVEDQELDLSSDLSFPSTGDIISEAQMLVHLLQEIKLTRLENAASLVHLPWETSSSPKDSSPEPSEAQTLFCLPQKKIVTSLKNTASQQFRKLSIPYR